MDLSEHVKEFRVLQKTHKIRVADYCREHILDYYEMVEVLKPSSHKSRDGRYSTDNRYAEAIMRDLTTGRKNFLFSGSDEAAKNLAFAYSLTQSCKLCNVNPYDYWEDLLTNAYTPSRTIDSFMPHLWQKQS